MAVSGVARLWSRRSAAVYHSFGHPTPYAYAENEMMEDELGEEAPLCGSHVEDEKEYETIMDMIGFGKFQIFLLLVCGWANASDAVEILCVSFILPSAECDLDLTSFMKGVLSATVFLGMMIGGYMWGCLGDSLGRKNTLVSSLLVNTLGKVNYQLVYGIPAPCSTGPRIRILFPYPPLTEQHAKYSRFLRIRNLSSQTSGSGEHQILTATIVELYSIFLLHW
jgi:hypothetical protein